MTTRTTRNLGTWTVTSAHVRAAALAALLLGAAVWARRPDLVVLGSPFLVVALWGQLTRPTSHPVAQASLTDRTLREGGSTHVRVTVDGVPADCDTTLTLSEAGWQQRTPVDGIEVRTGTHGPTEGTFEVRTLRWGAREIGTVAVAAASPWHAYRVGPVDLPRQRVVTLPLPATFDSSAPTPHPHGVVGQNRSLRRGTGAEFATIRPFAPGDRLRRIHWPSSLRAGVLHASTTYADEDAHIVLIVDALSDLGPREGVDGRPTSLDATVRAAGAIAEHFLSRGERLTVRTIGAADVPLLPTGTGTRHLRLVLENLAHIAPATDRHDDGERAIRHLDAHATCLVLTPLIDPTIVAVTSVLSARGLTTMVIDCFPEHLVSADAEQFAALAWRLRLLERDNEVALLRRHGVPVTPWRGSGSLDLMLRELTRHAARPRAVVR